LSLKPARYSKRNEEDMIVAPITTEDELREQTDVHAS
jgi:hypothetical protein